MEIMQNDRAWIRWSGGASPVPVDEQVEVMRRYAGRATGPSGTFRWWHDLYDAYGAEDVVAYRLPGCS